MLKWYLMAKHGKFIDAIYILLCLFSTYRFLQFWMCIFANNWRGSVILVQLFLCPSSLQVSVGLPALISELVASLLKVCLWDHSRGRGVTDLCGKLLYR